MTDRFVLDGQTPVPEPDLMKWAAWFEGPIMQRRVASTEIGDSEVSTVFLGLDHSFGEGPPLLFETLVFGGDFADEMDRYSTWDEAVAGHQKMVQRVGAGEKS